MSEEPIRGQAGGLARNKALPPDRKKEIARAAARARWGAVATHKGNLKEDFGIDVDCYVLNDEQKTPVISQTGMAQTVGLSSRGNSLPRFLATRAMTETVGADLRQKLENPLKFQWGSGGAEQPPNTVHGFDATLLIDLCKAIIGAEASGKLRNPKLAQQATIIINASAKLGIRGLVYKLAGYDATKQEVIAAFKLYVQEEAREYEREFPEELYDEWYRLYQLPRPERNRPWKFKHLTVEQVWKPLARSNGRIFGMTKARREESSQKYSKLHQFLSEIGVKALRIHLGKLTGIANVSSSKEEYERHFQRVFGQQLEMEFD